MSNLIKKAVEEWLKKIDYSIDPNYVPSEFALEFVNFIKLVNGEEGEEHATPVTHYHMLDMIAGSKQNITNLCSRGLAKTSVFAEYLFLYIAVYSMIPGFGKVDLAIYVSDSIENGVKNLRKNIEFRWEESDFLREYVPDIRFTDIRLEFNNKFGKRFIVKSYGAKTGVRGAKEMGKRPDLAILDDLISDDDARSPTVIASVEDTVYKAVDYALHPTKRKTIWSGTPFNARDPLYKAVESGAWYVNVYPVCEKFPCKEEDFKSAWPDRFDYKYVKSQYLKAKRAGKIDTFNQELMLRIISEEERLIKDSDLTWYNYSNLKKNRGAYNYYITTDFAVSDGEANDYSVINVWAYTNNRDWLWVDGFCKQVLMDKTIDKLFFFVQKWRPQSVGVEISGQQKGFIKWLQSEMMHRNIYFTIATGPDSNTPGLSPVKDKMSRFQQSAVPLFKSSKIWFPEELKDSEELEEMLEELELATKKGFKSKHDDQIDTISMLSEMEAWPPSEDSVAVDEDGNTVDEIWDEIDEDDYEGDSSYFV